MHKLISTLTLVALLAACSSNNSADVASTADEAMSVGKSTMMAKTDSSRLAAALAAQPQETKDRYGARNPKATMEFFGIAPGMTVMEALPGGGWYTKILLPYLGKDGALIGADYAQDMYPLFGFFSAERLEAKKTWVKDWTADAQSWGDANSASVAAFQFGSMPAAMAGTADAVVFIRALHNLKRFEGDGAYLSKALVDAYRILKPGGIVGVVQHRAPADAPEESVQGTRGYISEADLIATFEAASFDFVDSSEINANPKDQPAHDEIVWRLPPSMVTSREDADLRAKMMAIGESDRMTLKFRKK